MQEERRNVVRRTAMVAEEDAGIAQLQVAALPGSPVVCHLALALEAQAQLAQRPSIERTHESPW